MSLTSYEVSCIMRYMAKPFVTKNEKKGRLKSTGESKTYVSWSLRITLYDREVQAVRQKYLRALGPEAVLEREDAEAIVDEFGQEYGFTLDDLYSIENLTILNTQETGGD